MIAATNMWHRDWVAAGDRGQQDEGGPGRAKWTLDTAPEKTDSSQEGNKKSEGTGGGEKGDAQVKSKGPRSRVSMEIKLCGRE